MKNLRNSTAHFFHDDSGAVTVDWVVLTAALVGLGLAVMAVVSGGVEDLSGDIDAQLLSQEIITEFASAAFALTPDNFVSWHHSANWVNDTIAGWSDPSVISEQDLIAAYHASAAIVAAALPQDIASGHYHNAIDHMGAQEAAMAARGITVPNAGLTYEEAYNNFQSL